MAWRIFGMPRLAEYRWLRGLRAASASFSTATSGEGRSGLPNPRSMTSRPSRRAAAFRSLMVANTYGGSPLIRRNSMLQVTAAPQPDAPIGPVSRPADRAAARTCPGFRTAARLPPGRVGRLGDHVERLRPGADRPGGAGGRQLGQAVGRLGHGVADRAAPGHLHARPTAARPPGAASPSHRLTAAPSSRASATISGRPPPTQTGTPRPPAPRSPPTARRSRRIAAGSNGMP